MLHAYTFQLQQLELVWKNNAPLHRTQNRQLEVHAPFKFNCSFKSAKELNSKSPLNGVLLYYYIPELQDRLPRADARNTLQPVIHWYFK